LIENSLEKTAQKTSCGLIKLAQNPQPATAKKSRYATKKTAQLCEKTAQLATLLVTVREMKNTSQHCCDKTMGGKMALYRECCFLDCENYRE